MFAGICFGAFSTQMLTLHMSTINSASSFCAGKTDYHVYSFAFREAVRGILAANRKQMLPAVFDMESGCVTMLSHMAMTHSLKILPPPVWCLPPRPVVPDVRLFCANPPLA